MFRVEHDDMLQAIPRLVAEGIVCDACVTDPPYHLLPTVKRFAGTAIGGTSDVERRAKSREDGLGRLAGGFMGQQWDGGDIAFRPETWATVATILRPGAFLVAFGGTRTHHRVWSAIEDAGFVIQDTIMWLFGTGFPKRRDMLKPAFEPICLAYKPGGARTMQVDECRIATSDSLGGGGNTTSVPEGWDRPYRHDPVAIAFNAERTALRIAKAETLGRWPANICHDGSDEAVACFPESNSARASGNPNNPQHGQNNSHTSWEFGPLKETNDYRDTGSAARFFFSSKAQSEDRWGSRHPTVKPVELMKWLVALVTPPGGTVLDPFAGSGTTGAAAVAAGRKAILIEREDSYVADIRERLAFYEGDGKHSLAAKYRNRKPEHGPLFDQDFTPATRGGEC